MFPGSFSEKDWKEINEEFHLIMTIVVLFCLYRGRGPDALEIAFHSGLPLGTVKWYLENSEWISDLLVA